MDDKIKVLEKEKLHLVKMFDVLSKEMDQANEECKKAKSE